MNVRSFYLRVLTALFICSVGTAGIASAEPTSVNTRGLKGLWVANSASTVGQGNLVLGGSFFYGSNNTDNFDYNTYSLPVTVTYGFNDKFEGGLAVPVLMNVNPDGGSSESGFGDMNLSMKYAFQEETGEIPAMAFGGRLKLPTADDGKGLGTGDTDFGIFGTVDRMIGGIRGLLDVEYVFRGGDMENEVNYAVGVEIPYSETVGFSVELIDQGFITNEYLFGDMLMGAVNFDMHPSMNFGFNLGVGLNKPSTDVLFGAKLSFAL
jgi:hypothetical protein